LPAGRKRLARAIVDQFELLEIGFGQFDGVARRILDHDGHLDLALLSFIVEDFDPCRLCFLPEILEDPEVQDLCPSGFH